MDGLNENIEILGRSFHIQTEVIQGSSLKFRTTVFSSGTVIGKRETTVGGLVDDETEVKDLMQAQHTQIVENLVCRLEEMAETEAQEEVVEPPTPLSESEPLPRKQTPLPDLEETQGLLGSVRVRGLVARFRNQIDLEPPASTEELKGRLENAISHIRRILSSPHFPQIRLDEQVRFYDLEERIGAWLVKEPEHAIGVNLWSEIAVFSTYLGRINNRRELIEFDRRVLLWAFAEIGKTGLTDSVVEELQVLYGRELEFDRLLEDPESRGKQHWLSALVEILDAL